ncbi:helix-turn-helix transcriptional regulator [Paenibacillus macerans]|uniref:helix-turn-helix transcriptional regulator n=1 Tax=Paenibacillus macerans TaxID=44252 RepID=UPI002DB801C7|nr:helix-turn-helix transcriptional regulator [Paenibacillus macerans]MEC0140437.1 helix-turn-helix transcriptional regulator [Paenibacillus macerans]
MSNGKQASPRKQLILLRKKVGSQRKVASDLNISETYLRLLEKGKAQPSVELLFRTAHYLESDVYTCWPDLAGEAPKK